MGRLPLTDYKIYCPSYCRAKIATTHQLVSKSNFCFVVREEEKEQYRALGRELMVIPSGKVSNISQTRNWILNNKTTERVVMIDDDFRGIYSLIDRKRKKLSQSEVDCMIINGFQLSIDCRAGLWGINVMVDPRSYSVNLPFYFSSVVLGPFMAFNDTSLKFDERFKSTEDYDMFLQQLHKHRRVLRMNMFHYDCDHEKLSGGIQTYRTKQLEVAENALLKKKWGQVVRDNNWAEDSINVNIKTKL